MERRERRRERGREGMGREREEGRGEEERRECMRGECKERRREWAGRCQPSEETSQRSGTPREEMAEERRPRWPGVAIILGWGGWIGGTQGVHHLKENVSK